MPKYEVAIYAWEDSREKWVFVRDGWVDPREITSIEWNIGNSNTIGELSSVTVFKAQDYTYYTIAMSTEDAEYLNNRR